MNHDFLSVHADRNDSGFLPLTVAVSVFRQAMLAFLFATVVAAADDDPSKRLCRVTIVDAENGWPVPMVELRTTNDIQYVSDNAGVIAIDDAGLMNREVWFHVSGHGYGVPKDRFGYGGVRLMPQPGAALTVEVRRRCIAKRVGRLTGNSLFAESQKLGDEREWRDGPVFGCDSVLTAVHQGRLFWLWGDTNVASYPLGVFHSSSATTNPQPFDSFEPPLRPQFDYFLEENRGRPRGVAEMPGDGPTWLTAYVSLPDATGQERLVASYRKIAPPMNIYERGLCVWDDAEERFIHHRTLWKKSDGEPRPQADLDGHPAFWTDDTGKRWVLLGNPLPKIRFPATFEAWSDSATWEILTPQQTLVSAADGMPVQPHSGSIAFNPWRKRWVTVFMQHFGKPSAFGTLWYAESDVPTGPWGAAVEILSHDNYTFYNPRIHPEVTPDDEPILLFEGTYTDQFTRHARTTPRYDYNQILYRLDLDDPKLDGAK